MMRISTHILDTALGRPATGVAVSLSRFDAGTWMALASAVTDRDGRCADLLGEDEGGHRGGEESSPGVYRLRFETAGYYERAGVPGLYPFVEIAFEVLPGQLHYHIPLLLTANSYTTYRGS